MENEKKVIDRSIYKEAREQTAETIGDFIKHVMNDYHLDYSTVCFAVAASAIAAVHAADNQEHGGITGWQAGYIMFEIIRQMNYPNNKCGLRIINYDDMLFPQYGYKFEKTIDPDTFMALQEEALIRLKNHDAHPAVINHWKSIADGVVPFEYEIKGRY